MEWLARTYVHAMNCIHYMHDKYFYERLEHVALHDPRHSADHGIRHRCMSRLFCDSLSAIKYEDLRHPRRDAGDDCR